jgi:hypothetical protein
MPENDSTDYTHLVGMNLVPIRLGENSLLYYLPLHWNDLSRPRANILLEILTLTLVHYGAKIQICSLQPSILNYVGIDGS